MMKIKKKTGNQTVSRLRVNKKAPAFKALMRRLKDVTSSGPYTRDEMNER